MQSNWWICTFCWISIGLVKKWQSYCTLLEHHKAPCICVFDLNWCPGQPEERSWQLRKTPPAGQRTGPPDQDEGSSQRFRQSPRHKSLHGHGSNPRLNQPQPKTARRLPQYHTYLPFYFAPNLFLWLHKVKWTWKPLGTKTVLNHTKTTEYEP